MNLSDYKFPSQLFCSKKGVCFLDIGGWHEEFLVPRCPGPFFTPRFPEEQILSLLESSPKFAEDLKNTEFLLNVKISDCFQKFVEIFLCFRITFWHYYPTLKYKIHAEVCLNIFQNSFEFFGGFSGIFSDFLDNSYLEIPRGPQGINFIFLDPRGI